MLKIISLALLCTFASAAHAARHDNGCREFARVSYNQNKWIPAPNGEHIILEPRTGTNGLLSGMELRAMSEEVENIFIVLPERGNICVKGVVQANGNDVAEDHRIFLAYSAFLKPLN